MKTQTLTFRPGGKPIVIETPLGLIVMNRMKEDPRKVQIGLPEGMNAYIGEDRALKEARFIEKDELGRLQPKFGMLTPVTDESGELSDVTAPEVLKLKKNGDNHE